MSNISFISLKFLTLRKRMQNILTENWLNKILQQSTHGIIAIWLLYLHFTSHKDDWGFAILPQIRSSFSDNLTPPPPDTGQTVSWRSGSPAHEANCWAVKPKNKYCQKSVELMQLKMVSLVVVSTFENGDGRGPRRFWWNHSTCTVNLKSLS